MKLIIDTTLKTIQVEQSVSLDELSEEIKRMFPESYKEYKLVPSDKIFPYYPIAPVAPLPVYPSDWPFNPINPTICQVTNITGGNYN